MKRIKEDRGDAILVLGLFIMALFLMVGGTMLDFGKARQFKHSYNNAADLAAQSAIRFQHPSSGALKVEAAAEAMRVYELHSSLGVVGAKDVNDKRSKSLSRCNAQKTRVMTVYFSQGAKGTRHRIGSLDLNRISSGNSTANVLAKMSVANYNKNIKYDTIHIEVKESTPNLMLPTGLASLGNDYKGMMCQEIGVRGQASVFRGQSGVE